MTNMPFESCVRTPAQTSFSKRILERSCPTTVLSVLFALQCIDGLVSCVQCSVSLIHTYILNCWCVHRPALTARRMQKQPLASGQRASMETVEHKGRSASLPYHWAKCHSDSKFTIPSPIFTLHFGTLTISHGWEVTCPCRDSELVTSGELTNAFSIWHCFYFVRTATAQTDENYWKLHSKPLVLKDYQWYLDCFLSVQCWLWRCPAAKQALRKNFDPTKGSTAQHFQSNMSMRARCTTQQPLANME